MEFVILGLLQLQPMSGYEIGKFIKSNLTKICSESAGSIQTAIKKLLNSESVYFEERVSGNKTKKLFYVTDKGRQEFSAWIRTPMQSEKIKNMELSKLFFMGFTDKENRVRVVNNYIEQLREGTKATLKGKNIIDKILMNPENIPPEVVTHLEFQRYTIEFAIDMNEYEIAWYQNLLKRF